MIRALALSSGSSKGSYQIGALKYLLGDLQINYDILCGVSAGAINVSYLAQYPKGEEIISINNLADIWMHLQKEHIYRSWFPFNMLHAIWEKSLFDSSPLTTLIHNNISLAKIRASGKQVCIGAVSVSSGDSVIFSQHNPHFVDAVIASASMPGLFLPKKFAGHLWVDGANKEAVPLKAAIALGAEEIDVIITAPAKRATKFLAQPSAIDILIRSIDLSTDKILTNDLEKIELYNKLVLAGADKEKRYIKLNIIRPDVNLTDNLLDFSAAKMKNMLELGYQDAKNKYPLG